MVPAALTEQRAALSCLARWGALLAVRSPCFRPSDFFCFPRAWMGLPGCADFAQPEFAGGSNKVAANTEATRHHARLVPSFTDPLPTQITLARIRVTPRAIMPSACAAPRERSRTRPRTNGP